MAPEAEIRLQVPAALLLQRPKHELEALAVGVVHVL